MPSCGKYPGGGETQKGLLEGEGHVVIRKGRRFVVAEFEKRLLRL
jgi:hypothetical protein